jgi:hypothetical protein
MPADDWAVRREDFLRVKAERDDARAEAAKWHQAWVASANEYEAEAKRLREALRDVERCADGNASPERLRRIVADALAPAATGEDGP